MSTAFPLPLECLQLVLRQLANDGDACTLACLLRTNKHICSATLPILYEDPFKMLTSSLSSTHGAPSRLSMLVRVLFESIPRDRISDLLRAAFLQKSSEQDHQSLSEGTAIPYSSFVIRVRLRPYTFLAQRVFNSADSRFGDYLEHSGLDSLYKVEGIFDRHKHGSKGVVRYTAAQELCKDLAWALCVNAESIRSLVIPISDVARYLSVVSHFKLLEDVTFVLDKDIREFGRLDQLATPKDLEVMNRQRAERMQHLEEMVSFIQEHRRHHQHVLVTGRCIKEGGSLTDCPEEYQLRLLQSLPPLINPRSLNHHNWTQFIVKAQDTNVSFVKSFVKAFDPPSVSGARSLDRLVAPESFLHRCRSLEDFNTAFISKGVFQWAVEERKQYNAEIAAGRLPQQPLVPLRDFVVKHGQLSAGVLINDVAFAFSNTLETIDISGEWRQQNLDQEASDSTMDNDESIWSLPRLSKLEAKTETEDGYLHIHSKFLSRCPRLDKVFLSDRLRAYSLDNVEHWQRATLPHTTILDLRGTPAVSFHPDTFKNTPNLAMVRLGTIWYDSPYIPPPEDFVRLEDGEPTGMSFEETSPTSPSSPSRPPIWTWDWELPKLTYLYLDSEFAYRFQFRMLGGTPSLSMFECDIRSTSGLHRRLVRPGDLISPGSTTHQQQGMDKGMDLQMDDELSWREHEYIHLPALRSFILTGPWTLSGQILEVLFSRVAPNMGDVKLRGCDGSTLAQWVDLTSKHLHGLVRAFTSIEVNRTDVASIGLVPIPSSMTRFVLVNRPEGRILEAPAEYFFDAIN